VVMEVAPQYWQDPNGLKNIYIAPGGSSASGSSTTRSAPIAGLNRISPLMSVMKASSNTTPLQVNHTGLFPSATVSFNMASGMSLSDATREVTQMEQKMGMPSSVRGFFAGTAQAYQDSLATEKYLVITALLAVFIVLGILYESLVHPITIISTLPSASVGAMLALMLFKMDLNVISIIGIILLIGIVKKNAIMMIDFALQAERNEGKNTRDSIFEACMLRFRPIMMTTFSAIMGALPLAFGTGTGSELRRPLGITIVGGLLLSQMLTLYTTPVIYLMMDRMRHWALSRGHDLRPATAEGAAS
jgi:multidrug efflux pump